MSARQRVELNPVFVKLLTRDPRFANFTNLSKLPGVRFFVGEGHSWFARAPGQAWGTSLI